MSVLCWSECRSGSAGMTDRAREALGFAQELAAHLEVQTTALLLDFLAGRI